MVAYIAPAPNSSAALSASMAALATPASSLDSTSVTIDIPGTVPSSEEKSEEKKEVINCAICLSDLSSEIVETQCSHQFHFECIKKWIKSIETNPNNSCPFCRRQITQISCVESSTIPGQALRDKVAALNSKLNVRNLQVNIRPANNVRNIFDRNSSICNIQLCSLVLFGSILIGGGSALGYILGETTGAVVGGIAGLLATIALAKCIL